MPECGKNNSRGPFLCKSRKMLSVIHENGKDRILQGACKIFDCWVTRTHRYPWLGWVEVEHAALTACTVVHVVRKSLLVCNPSRCTQQWTCQRAVMHTSMILHYARAVRWERHTDCLPHCFCAVRGAHHTSRAPRYSFAVHHTCRRNRRPTRANMDDVVWQGSATKCCGTAPSWYQCGLQLCLARYGPPTQRPWWRVHARGDHACCVQTCCRSEGLCRDRWHCPAVNLAPYCASLTGRGWTTVP